MIPTETSNRIRGRLIQVVTKLARAVDAGEAMPQPNELEALATVLEEQRLPIEAARVRRWIQTTR